MDLPSAYNSVNLTLLNNQWTYKSFGIKIKDTFGII